MPRLQPASALRRYASTSSSAQAYPSSSSSSSSDANPYAVSTAPKPPLKTWYTGRPALSAFLQELSSHVKKTRETLYRSGIIASVDADVRGGPTGSGVPASPMKTTTGVRWLPADAIGSKLGVANVRLAYYRQITSLLSELHQLVPLLSFGSEQAVHSQQQLLEMLQKYVKVDARVEQASGVKQKGYGYTDDKTGIAYGLGRKKTASARAWVLPLQPATIAGEEGAGGEDKVGTIMVNGLSLTRYFSDVAHRSVITRPLKLTESLGRYNVFVLVQGGGYSSKSAAAAVAIARALASLGDVDASKLELAEASEETKAVAVAATPFPPGANRLILAKADLLRRDPRVVERKKTGRPKARKRFTWVKR